MNGHRVPPVGDHVISDAVSRDGRDEGPCEEAAQQAQGIVVGRELGPYAHFESDWREVRSGGTGRESGLTVLKKDARKRNRQVLESASVSMAWLTVCGGVPS